MLQAFAVAVINHLLAREVWAVDRLRPFAGRSIAIRLAPFNPFVVAITAEGRVAPAIDDHDPTPSLAARLGPDTLGAIVRGAPWWDDLALEGDAALATVCRYLAQHLRWDPTDDLARVVGDIPAERITTTGRALHEWQRDARARLAASIGEYVSAEKGIVAARSEIDALATDARGLTDAVSALEARIATLERVKSQPAR